MGKFFEGWKGITLFYVLGAFDLIWMWVCPSFALPLGIVGVMSIVLGATNLYKKIKEKRHPKKQVVIREVSKDELNNMTQEWLLDVLEDFKRRRLYSATLTLSNTEDEKVIVKRVTKSDLDVAITIKQANAIREKKQKQEHERLIKDTLQDLAQNKVVNREEVVSALMNKDWLTLENRVLKQNTESLLQQSTESSNKNSPQESIAKKVENNSTENKPETEMDLTGFKPEMAEYIKKLKQKNKSKTEDSNTLNM